MFLLLLLALSIAAVLGQDVALDLQLEHSIANGPWTSRGNVKFTLKRAEKMLSVKLDNPTFTIDSGADIAKLNSPTTFVRLRVPAVDANGAILPNKFLLTSIPGCALLRDTKEVLSLITDKTGAVLGLQYERPIPSASADCRRVQNGEELPKSLKLATKIVAVMPKEQSLGMALPTNADVLRETIPQQQQQQGAGAGAGGETVQNAFQQSFLVKYWYIVLPAFIVYTIYTAPNMPQEEGGAAQAPAAAAAAASKAD